MAVLQNRSHQLFWLEAGRELPVGESVVSLLSLHMIYIYVNIHLACCDVVRLRLSL